MVAIKRGRRELGSEGRQRREKVSEDRRRAKQRRGDLVKIETGEIERGDRRNKVRSTKTERRNRKPRANENCADREAVDQWQESASGVLFFLFLIELAYRIQIK